MRTSTETASIGYGLRFARDRWLLVIAVWIVTVAALAPAGAIVRSAVAKVFVNWPSGFEPPPGEVRMLMIGALREIAQPAAVALIAGLVLLWAWTILWHAGVARALVWDENGPAPVSRILGFGLGAWWRYLRLSLTSLAVLVVALAVVWIPLGLAIEASFDAAADDRVISFAIVGLVLTPIVKFIVWGSTLRGAWEVARPGARSAVTAWVRGLVGAVRHPLSTLAALLALGLAGALVAAAPAIVQFAAEDLRGSPIALVLTLVSGVVAAFLAVALFAAFAPVSEIAGLPAVDESE